MRVIQQLARPGVQHGGERGERAEMAGITAEVEQRRRCRIESSRTSTGRRCSSTGPISGLEVRFDKAPAAVAFYCVT
jgi:hypothetical protein